MATQASEQLSTPVTERSALSLATVSANATRTYALVVILAALGLIVVNLAEVVKKRVLHWWGNS